MPRKSNSPTHITAHKHCDKCTLHQSLWKLVVDDHDNVSIGVFLEVTESRDAKKYIKNFVNDKKVEMNGNRIKELV